MPSQKGILVGPILGVESSTTFTIVFSTPPELDDVSIKTNGTGHVCQQVGSTPRSTIWRGQLSVKPQPALQSLTYSIHAGASALSCQNGRSSWTFQVPGEDETAKIAYASCNGFSSADLMHKTEDPYMLWRKLEAEHQQSPFSLILLGGDQLYADEIWSAVPELQKWNELPRKKKVARTASKTMLEQIERFFDQLYANRWSDPTMSLMLAQVPNLMMWDDHDIFDGWGSFPPDLQGCEVFQAIFQVAKRYFSLFQIRSDQNSALLSPDGDHFGYVVEYHDYIIAALDNRAERNLTQVMSPAQWGQLKARFSQLPTDKNLLVLSAVPVVYRDFSLAEAAFDLTPWEEELTDDLKDHWRAKEHEGERAKLIHLLLDDSGTRLRKTVILSGDVHIGCIGVIQDKARGCNVHQVVSSGIVHPAPSRLQWLGILAATNDDDEFLDENREIRISLVRPFGSDKYIRQRNYITLREGTDEKLWVNWMCEDESRPSFPIAKIRERGLPDAPDLAKDSAAPAPGRHNSSRSGASAG